MKTNLYNLKGEIVKEIDLNEDIFGKNFDSEFVHRIYVRYLSNRRQPLAQTKDRGEVRGGGKKPWPQKGTGRARHASIRSPLWKGGGVVFGPRQNERNFKKKINKKERRLALCQVLSQKLKDNEIIVLEDIKLEQGKTKEIIEILKNLNLIDKKERKPKKSTLIIINPSQKEIKKAAENIDKLKVITSESLDLVDLLNYKYLIFSYNVLKDLEKKLISV